MPRPARSLLKSVAVALSLGLAASAALAQDPTETPTSTPTSTETLRPTSSGTPSSTQTETLTPTVTQTHTPAATPTITRTPTPGPTLFVVGPELRISPPGAGGSDHDAEVAGRADGSFVSAWTQQGDLSDTGPGVFGRISDKAGTTLGVLFHANSFTTGFQRHSAVAGLPDGSFAVTWDSTESHDGDGRGIFAQHFASGGTKLGQEFQVNTRTTGYQGYPTAASLTGGGFVLIWKGPGSFLEAVLGQRYDATGAPTGSELQVSPAGVSVGTYSAISGRPDGGFVVAWESFTGGDANFDIGVQLFDSAGTALGAFFQANSYTPGGQLLPDVSSGPDGGFVVVWEDRGGQDGSGSGIFGQSFDSAGARIGGEFQVNTTTSADQMEPALASSPSGGFVAVWQGQDGAGTGIIGRPIDAAAGPRGEELVVNLVTTGDQQQAAIASIGGSSFVAEWDTEQSGVISGRVLVLGTPTPPELPQASRNGSLALVLGIVLGAALLFLRPARRKRG